MLETRSLPVELWSCRTWRDGKARNLEGQIQCSTYGAEERTKVERVFMRRTEGYFNQHRPTLPRKGGERARVVLLSQRACA
jgi:hypothetical protein